MDIEDTAKRQGPFHKFPTNNFAMVDLLPYRFHSHQPHSTQQLLLTRELYSYRIRCVLSTIFIFRSTDAFNGALHHLNPHLVATGIWWDLIYLADRLPRGKVTYIDPSPAAGSDWGAEITDNHASGLGFIKDVHRGNCVPCNLVWRYFSVAPCAPRVTACIRNKSIYLHGLPLV